MRYFIDRGIVVNRAVETTNEETMGKGGGGKGLLPITHV